QMLSPSFLEERMRMNLRQSMTWAVLTVGAMTSPAMAQTPPVTTTPAPVAAPAEAAKRTTITVGSDLTSAYMFRGIFQADSGAIIQPAFDLGITLGKGVSMNVGNWES